MHFLPTPEFGERGHEFTYQLPLQSEHLEGKYIPAIDGVYISDEDFSDGDSFVEGPIKFQEGDKIIEKTKNIANKESVFQHEMGHAILTNDAITQSNIFSSQFLYTKELMRLTAVKDLEENIYDEEVSEHITNRLKQTVHNYLFVSLQKKILKPVHETFALITELCYCEKETSEAILEQITRIDQKLGRDNLDQSHFDPFIKEAEESTWSMSHPGYDPLAYSQEEQVEQWENFVYSYQRSCLMASWFIFNTLDEEFAHELLSQAARSAVYMHLLSEKDVSDIPSRGVPIVLFADAIESFYQQRFALRQLRKNGVEDELIERIYQEWLSFGSIGLEKVRRKIIQNTPDISPGEGLPSYKQEIQYLHERVERISGPTIVFIENSESNNLNIYYNEGGIPLRFILFTLLRLRLLEIISRMNSKRTKFDFFTENYNMIFEAISRDIGASDLNEHYLQNWELIANWCYEKEKYDEIFEEAVAEYQTEFEKSGWGEIKGILSEDFKIGSFNNYNPGRLPQKLAFYASLPPTRQLRHTTSFMPIFYNQMTNWREISIEDFISGNISSITQFSGVKPETSRIRRLSRIVERMVESFDDGDEFIGKVYGRALGDIISYIPFNSYSQWLSRIFRAFEMTYIKKNMGIDSIIILNKEMFKSCSKEIQKEDRSGVRIAAKKITDYTFESSELSGKQPAVIQSSMVKCIKEVNSDIENLTGIRLLIEYLCLVDSQSEFPTLVEASLIRAMTDIAKENLSEPDPSIINITELVLGDLYSDSETRLVVLIKLILTSSYVMDKDFPNENYEPWIQLFNSKIEEYFKSYIT
ncbi:hypothetical protein [Halobacteriaceae bacterium SHR40]|uniref:hypothetical protein n=1 Tax=Halovenus amylolytica TaxID=2500550 RepID=UPI000FE337A0